MRKSVKVLWDSKVTTERVKPPRNVGNDFSFYGILCEHEHLYYNNERQVFVFSLIDKTFSACTVTPLEEDTPWPDDVLVYTGKEGSSGLKPLPNQLVRRNDGSNLFKDLFEQRGGAFVHSGVTFLILRPRYAWFAPYLDKWAYGVDEMNTVFRIDLYSGEETYLIVGTDGFMFDTFSGYAVPDCETLMFYTLHQDGVLFLANPDEGDYDFSNPVRLPGVNNKMTSKQERRDFYVHNDERLFWFTTLDPNNFVELRLGVPLPTDSVLCLRESDECFFNHTDQTEIIYTHISSLKPTLASSVTRQSSGGRLAGFRNEGDVVFKCKDGERVKVSGFLLMSTRSPVLSGLLAEKNYNPLKRPHDEQRETEINCQYDGEVMQSLVGYINGVYTMTENPTDYLNNLLSADYYDLPEYADVCISGICTDSFKSMGKICSEVYEEPVFQRLIRFIIERVLNPGTTVAQRLSFMSQLKDGGECRKYVSRFIFTDDFDETVVTVVSSSKDDEDYPVSEDDDE